LDSLFLIKILLKLNQQALAEQVLLELFQEFVLTLDTKEINKNSSEHRVIFLIHDDSYLKDGLMMKGIPLVDFQMIQQMFLENSEYFEKILKIKDDIKFDAQECVAQVVCRYYEKLLRLRTVSF
jgi:hypothetical protein